MSVFAVNAMHNLVHLLTGVAFLAGGLLLTGKERVILQAVAVASPGALEAFVLLGLLALVPVVYNKWKKSSLGEPQMQCTHENRSHLYNSIDQGWDHPPNNQPRNARSEM